MDISKNDFVRLTTQGYPIKLKHTLDDFYLMFADFVNQSKENNFYAELNDGVVLHAGMRTEVCKIIHKEGKVIILSKITSEDENSTSDEFSLDETLQILGLACLGVLYFCDMYAEATDQISKKKFEKYEGDNTKYDIWPV